jgi:hypothetical protein
LINHPLLQELPVELEISIEKEEFGVQTEEVDGFGGVEVIEVAVEISHPQEITQDVRVERKETTESK